MWGSAAPLHLLLLSRNSPAELAQPDTEPGVDTLQPVGHVRLRVAMSVAQCFVGGRI